MLPATSSDVASMSMVRAPESRSESSRSLPEELHARVGAPRSGEDSRSAPRSPSPTRGAPRRRPSKSQARATLDTDRPADPARCRHAVLQIVAVEGLVHLPREGGEEEGRGPRPRRAAPSPPARRGRRGAAARPSRLRSCSASRRDALGMSHERSPRSRRRASLRRGCSSCSPRAGRCGADNPAPHT